LIACPAKPVSGGGRDHTDNRGDLSGLQPFPGIQQQNFPVSLRQLANGSTDGLGLVLIVGRRDGRSRDLLA
jgi:hypothetical protein